MNYHTSGNVLGVSTGVQKKPICATGNHFFVYKKKVCGPQKYGDEATIVINYLLRNLEEIK